MRKILRYFGYDLMRTSSSRGQPLELKDYLERTEGMISLLEAGLLYGLAKTVRGGSIVEVGSYRGRSTVALGRGSLDGHRVPVFAIEPHEPFTGVLGGQFGPEDRGAFFRAMLATECYRVVRLVNLSSEQIAKWNLAVELLWIDGDHSYQGVKRDYECWEKCLKAGADVAFDDSLSPELGPKQLIDELIASGRLERLREVGKVTHLRFIGPPVADSRPQRVQ